MLIANIRKKQIKVKVLHRRRFQQKITCNKDNIHEVIDKHNGNGIGFLIQLHPLEEGLLYRFYTGTKFEGKELGFQPTDILSTGGDTTVTIIDSDQRYSVQSVCSNKDNFNRKVAINIALGRLFKDIKEQNPNLYDRITNQ